MTRWKKAASVTRGAPFTICWTTSITSRKWPASSMSGLGSDFDGVSKLPEQLEDVSCYPYITQGLLDRGYTDEQIRGILGGNLMRVFRGVEAYAAKHRRRSAVAR